MRENIKRGVTGTSCIEGKQLAVRPDLIFYRNGVEYGAGEVGKEDLAGVGKKELIETQLHCPKVLKDMMNLAATKCGNKESLLRSLRLVAYNQTRKYTDYFEKVGSLFMYRSANECLGPRLPWRVCLPRANNPQL